MPASTTAPLSPLEELAIEHAHRDFAHVSIAHTVAEALAAIRASDVRSRIVYFYVLDEEGRLTMIYYLGLATWLLL